MTTEQQISPPAPSPEPDEDSIAYWEGLAEHRLLLQRCTECARPRFPAMASCPYCGLSGHTIIEASGRGRLYAWVVVHRAFHPAFAGGIPYTVATVDLAEGPRILGRLDGEMEPVAGAHVLANYVEHDGWTELRFVDDVA